MRLSRAFAAAIGIVVLILAGLACFDTNPHRAGESKTPGFKPLSHDLSYAGVGHASGLCDPVNYCSACHGADLRGGTSGQPSCYECHQALWTRPNCGTMNHTVSLGGVLHAPNPCQPLDNCVYCHGADLRGNASTGAPSCLQCHGAVWELSNCGANAHTVNLGGVFHAPNFCMPQANCSGCHGSDLKGNSQTGAPSCFECHTDFWNNPGCGQNTHTVNLGGVFHAPNYCRPYQNCVSCHGAQLHGGPDGAPSCLQCHDSSAWFNCVPHNQSQDGHRHAAGLCTPTDTCVLCHGADLRGGLNGEPSCFSCHDQTWPCGMRKARVRR